jgi:hypothetical protein
MLLYSAVYLCRQGLGSVENTSAEEARTVAEEPCAKRKRALEEDLVFAGPAEGQ